MPARAPEPKGSSKTQEGVGPSGEILGTTMSVCPLPLQKNPYSVFGQMPDFYSEAEATTYEVIFGAVFEAESHWPAGKAPPRDTGSPPSREPIKAHVPASAATGHLHQPTKLEAGEAHRRRASAALGEGWSGVLRTLGMGLIYRSAHGHLPRKRQRR